MGTLLTRLETRLAELKARATDSADEQQELAELEAQLAELKVNRRVSRIISYAELRPVKGIRYSRTHLKRLEDLGFFEARASL